MLPKLQNALTILFIIFFVNVAFVAYNVVDVYMNLNLMPPIHANLIGLANGIIGLIGIIGLYVKSHQF